MGSRRNNDKVRLGRAQVGINGTPYSISDIKLAGDKRERRSKSSQQFSVDVPGLFFGAIMIVFVLWPAAQWALGI